MKTPVGASFPADPHGGHRVNTRVGFHWVSMFLTRTGAADRPTTVARLLLEVALLKLGGARPPATPPATFDPFDSLASSPLVRQSCDPAAIGPGTIIPTVTLPAAGPSTPDHPVPTPPTIRRNSQLESPSVAHSASFVPASTTPLPASRRRAHSRTDTRRQIASWRFVPPHVAGA